MLCLVVALARWRMLCTVPDIGFGQVEDALYSVTGFGQVEDALYSVTGFGQVEDAVPDLSLIHI